MTKCIGDQMDRHAVVAAGVVCGEHFEVGSAQPEFIMGLVMQFDECRMAVGVAFFGFDAVFFQSQEAVAGFETGTQSSEAFAFK